MPLRQVAIALAGLRRDDPIAPWAGGAREAIAWAGSLGVRAVQLDATTPGVRPRDLDRSGRRDLAALLRRTELEFTGLDLWLPAEHLTSPTHVDRAVSALSAAIGLCAEIAPLAGGGGRVVSVLLPAGVGKDVVHQVGAEADRHGVRLADHAWPPRGEVMDKAVGGGTLATGGQGSGAGADVTSAWPASIGVGLDPAAVVLAGEDVGSASARVADRLLSARLCDLSSAGRVLPGSGDGRVDLLAYRVGLSLAPALVPLVIDVRGLQEQDASARRMIADWRAGEGPGV